MEVKGSFCLWSDSFPACCQSNQLPSKCRRRCYPASLLGRSASASLPDHCSRELETLICIIILIISALIWLLDGRPQRTAPEGKHGPSMAQASTLCLSVCGSRTSKVPHTHLIQECVLDLSASVQQSEWLNGLNYLHRTVTTHACLLC